MTTSDLLARLPHSVTRWCVLASLGGVAAFVLLTSIALGYMGYAPVRAIAVAKLDDHHIWGPRTAFLHKAKQLERGDAEASASTALKAGNTRLLGGAGLGLVVPGLPASEYAKYETEDKVQLLYSGCEISSAEEMRYRDAAYRYAERYNRVILNGAPK